MLTSANAIIKISVLKANRALDLFWTHKSVLLWDAFGFALASTGATLGNYLLVRSITPTSFGHISTLIALSYLFHFHFSCACNAFYRYCSTAIDNSSTAAFYQVFHVTTFKICLWYIALAIVIGGVTACSNYREYFPIVAWSLILGLVAGLSLLISALPNALRQKKINALTRGGMPWGRALLAILLVTIFGESLNVVASGYILATVLILLIQLYVHRKTWLRLTTNKTSIDATLTQEWEAKIFRFTQPYIWTYFLGYLTLYTDRWAITLFSDYPMHDMGIYAAYFSLGFSPCVLVTAFVLQQVTPGLVRKANDCTNHIEVRQCFRQIDDLILLISGVTALLTIVVWYYSVELSHLILTEPYWENHRLFPAAILAGGAFAVSQVSSYTTIIVCRIDFMFRIQVVTSVCSVLFFAVGVYLGGLTGMMWVLPVFNIVNALISLTGKNILERNYLHK